LVIDRHCHVGVGDGLTGPWDTRASLGAYLRRAQQARILTAHPRGFYNFAFGHVARDAGRVAAMVREVVQRYGFVGIGNWGLSEF
jgi:hypothetical protein